MGRLFVLFFTSVLVACGGSTNPVTEAHSGSRSDLCDPNTPIVFERARSSGVPEVDIDWLQKHQCAVRVVDIREADEIASGIMASADWVPMAKVVEDMQSTESEKPTVFVCRSGRRSGRIVAELEHNGFQNIASLTGGMIAWQAAKLPIKKTQDGLEKKDPAIDRNLPLKERLLAHLSPEFGHFRAASLFMQGHCLASTGELMTV